MQVYSPSEAAELLGIKTATLRKYSLLLESNGYEIARNSKRHRYYQDKDVMTIRTVITSSNNGITLKESVKNVVRVGQRSNESNETYNVSVPNDGDIQQLKEMMIKQDNRQNNRIEELNNKIDNQSKFLIKQNELIGNLINRIDDQDKYISDKLTAPIEQKEIEAPKEAQPVKFSHNKKGLLARLFKR